MGSCPGGRDIPQPRSADVLKPYPPGPTGLETSGEIQPMLLVSDTRLLRSLRITLV